MIVTVDCSGQTSGEPPDLPLPAPFGAELPSVIPPRAALPDDADPEADPWPAACPGAGVAYPGLGWELADLEYGSW